MNHDNEITSLVLYACIVIVDTYNNHIVNDTMDSYQLEKVNLEVKDPDLEPNELIRSTINQ